MLGQSKIPALESLVLRMLRNMCTPGGHLWRAVCYKAIQKKKKNVLDDGAEEGISIKWG